MKKSLAVLGTVGVGVGAGVLLAMKSRRGKTNEEADSADAAVEQTSATENDGASNTSGKAAAAPMAMAETEPVIDDLGTDQAEASQILKHIRDTGFDSSDEKLALALGRPTEEIQQWTSGDGTIDGDVVMKARTLAIERGIEI